MKREKTVMRGNRPGREVDDGREGKRSGREIT
jgi:hypothetical protein